MPSSANKLAFNDRQAENLAPASPAPIPVTGVRMTALRILHVDDEPDIREVVELSLSLDAAFTVRSCASGGDALALAAEWPPDLILCDVVMPVMDGPATLARLRESPQTAHIPVVFMTARAQTRELEHFNSLGAAGVISKPFDPMTLAGSIRRHLRTLGISALRESFIRRLRGDATVLSSCRDDLTNKAAAATALGQIKRFSHALAGAAGIFGYHNITSAAVELEKAVTEKLDGRGARGKVEQTLDTLLVAIEQQHRSEPQ